MVWINLGGVGNIWDLNRDQGISVDHEGRCGLCFGSYKEQGDKNG